MKSTNLLLIAILTIPMTASLTESTISNEKQQVIDTLLEQTHASAHHFSNQLAASYIAQINAILKQSHPDISPEKSLKIEHTVKRIVEQRLVIEKQFSQLVSPLYAESLSIEELTTIIEFNKTEFGQKLLKIMPMISRETSALSAELELDLAPEINEQVLNIIDEQ